MSIPVSPENPLDISMASELIQACAADAVQTKRRQPEIEREVKLAWSDPDRGIWLYQANCLTWMDRVAKRWPDGVFDMIFADPPYSLSNGGFTWYTPCNLRS